MAKQAGFASRNKAIVIIKSASNVACAESHVERDRVVIVHSELQGAHFFLQDPATLCPTTSFLLDSDKRQDIPPCSRASPNPAYNSPQVLIYSFSRESGPRRLEALLQWKGSTIRSRLPMLQHHPLHVHVEAERMQDVALPPCCVVSVEDRREAREDVLDRDGSLDRSCSGTRTRGGRRGRGRWRGQS